MRQDERLPHRISNSSSGGDVILRYADLCLSTFGSLESGEQDRVDLAEHLGFEAVRWINERFDLGLKEGGSETD